MGEETSLKHVPFPLQAEPDVEPDEAIRKPRGPSVLSQC
jgi:hypothetical protein